MTSTHLQRESNLLFQAYQNGDTAALGELYNRWHGYVTNTIRKSHTFQFPSDIEDISANVWLLIQQEATKWDTDRSGWYLFLNYKIQHAIFAELKKQNRRRNILQEKGYIEIPDLPILDNPEEEQDFHNSTETINNSGVLGSALYVNSEPSVLESLISEERHEILEKAIKVCQFTPETERVLQLRLKGAKLQEIQKQMGLKSLSCVHMQLQRAITDLKQVINPITYEVSDITPKQCRRHQKQQHLQQAGQKLKCHLEIKSLTLKQVSDVLKINVSVLEDYLAGKSKPRAPRLKKLAALIGEEIYDIYMPPLPHAKWQKQGQLLWQMRVKNGLTLAKISKITQIQTSILIRYEAGELKMTPEAIAKISELFQKRFDN